MDMNRLCKISFGMIYLVDKIRMKQEMRLIFMRDLNLKKDLLHLIGLSTVINSLQIVATNIACAVGMNKAERRNSPLAGLQGAK